MPDLTYSAASGVANITLASGRGNPLRVATFGSLVESLDRADRDPEIGAVVLSAAGTSFSVGADLTDGAFESVDAQGPDWHEPAGVVALRIFAMNKPVIAAMHGAAVGGGATITLPCDYRLGTPDTRIGFVFAQRGIFPEGTSTWFLPRIVGLGRALDWLVSGRIVEAAEALDAGLLHSLHDDVDAAAIRLARTLVASTAPVSVAVTRRLLFHAAGAVSPADVQPVDSRLTAGIVTSADASEGVRSFLAKREPRFPGRVPADLPPWLPWLSPDAQTRHTHTQ